MDIEKFEEFTRDVSRRGVIRSLFGALAGAGLATGLLLDDVEAKKRGKKKGKGKGKKGKEKKNRRNQNGRNGGRVTAKATVSPNVITGNVEHCPAGQMPEIKVDAPENSNRSVTLDTCGTCTINATVSADDKVLSFTTSSNCQVVDVYVKGGPDTNHYHFPDGTQAQTGLVSPPHPTNQNNPEPEISHYIFCTIECADCQSTCGDRECGVDACGRPCGDCETGERCNENGQCVCAPDCSGTHGCRDGCGNVCPDSCQAPDTCNENGQCECNGTCREGRCRDECGDPCPCPPDYHCNEASGICEPDQCKPKCDGKVCGSDGCDGNCGPGCPKGETCNANGTCEPGTCTPYCPKGKCGGDDGCYGICGCPDGKVCKKGLCCQPNVSAAAQRRRLAKRRKGSRNSRNQTKRRSKR